ncbi:MAG: DUF1836 domain-containing protein [Ruminococcaceae bacterium]|nr:DUF1836 domain-containing protein [Oscillospiraceae bacterium]
MEISVKDIKEINKRLCKWCEDNMAIRLPRWEELPELELYMDQVIAFTEKHLQFFSEDGTKVITPSIINNYVKLGIIPPPVRKRYSRTHLAYLIMVCTLKQIMPIPTVQILISRKVQRFSVDSVYNDFCDAQESAFKKSLGEASARFIDGGDYAFILEDISLSMAVAANAEKAVAAKIILEMKGIDSEK